MSTSSTLAVPVGSVDPGGHDLALEDVAALTGKAERTVRRWTEVGRRDRGLLRAVHTVNGLRFRAQDVEDYLRPRPVLSSDGPRPVDLEAALEAGRLAGERLAQTPLLPDQQALLATVLVPLRIKGGTSR